MPELTVRLLRGMVVIREHLDADVEHFKHIIVPGVSTRNDRDAVARNRTWHRGEVLAMGPPAKTAKGVEVEPGFEVGSVVVFHFDHHEKAWTRPWVDGKNAVWCPQQMIDAVIQ